jgi:hypothetical protein
MSLRKMLHYAPATLGGKARNHVSDVLDIFRTNVLALEKQLQVRCEIRNSLRGVQYCLVPIDSEGVVTTIDPVFLIAFRDGDVEAPRFTGISSAP